MAKPTVFNPDKANVGLFCEVFPPVMDGVSVCMENYAYWLQKKVGGVAVVTPHVPKADYSVHEYKVFDYMSIPVPKRRPYMTGIAAFDPTYLAKIATTRFKIVHAHTPFSAGSAALSISRAQKIPLVATFHSKYRDDFSKILPKLVVDMMIDSVVDFFERADLVWVPQESVIDVIREYGYKGHVEVMDNGSTDIDVMSRKREGISYSGQMDLE